MSDLEGPDPVPLDFAWRFREGSEPDGAGLAVYDAGWRPARPSLPRDDFPEGWPGVGWFRRHVRFAPDRDESVLAVRYTVPAGSDSGGFVLSLAAAGRFALGPQTPASVAGLEGAAVAVPLFLAFLYLAFFAFYPRAKENLWYALDSVGVSLRELTPSHDEG